METGLLSVMSPIQLQLLFVNRWGISLLVEKLYKYFGESYNETSLKCIKKSTYSGTWVEPKISPKK